MNQQIMDQFKQFVETTGKISQHVWKVMVHQALVNSISTIIGFTIFAMFLALSWWTLNKIAKKCESDDGGVIVWGIVNFAITIIFVLLLSLSINSIVTGFVNPEYNAISTILDTLKSHK